VLLLTPILLDAIGGKLFIFFGALLFTMGAIFFVIIPETKGKSPSEVVAELNGGKGALQVNPTLKA
jgi:hypothetical protein